MTKFKTQSSKEGPNPKSQGKAPDAASVVSGFEVGTPFGFFQWALDIVPCVAPNTGL
jgi:hypothetical protein